MTFYNHYQDKYDLFNDIIEKLKTNLIIKFLEYAQNRDKRQECSQLYPCPVCIHAGSPVRQAIGWQTRGNGKNLLFRFAESGI